MSIKHPLKIPKRCTAGHLLSSYDVFCVSASFMAIYSLKLTFVATFLFITYNNNYPFMALDPGQCRQVSLWPLIQDNAGKSVSQTDLLILDI